MNANNKLIAEELKSKLIGVMAREIVDLLNMSPLGYGDCLNVICSVLVNTILTMSNRIEDVSVILIDDIYTQMKDELVNNSREFSRGLH